MELKLHQINTFLNSVHQAVALHPFVPQLQVEERLQQLTVSKVGGNYEVYFYSLLAGSQKSTLSKITVQLESLIAIQATYFLRADRH